MLHWYQIAADANSTEGLFLLGWAHHRGVGVPRNLTTARELYLRAVQQAGKTHKARSIAARLGLVAMWIDAVLLPIFGDDATQRVADYLRGRLGIGRARRGQQELPVADGGLLGRDGGEASSREEGADIMMDGRDAEGKEAVLLESGQDVRVGVGSKLLDWMAKAWKGIAVKAWAVFGFNQEVRPGRRRSWLELVENVTVTILLVGLIIVLRLRKQRRRLAGAV